MNKRNNTSYLLNVIIIHSSPARKSIEITEIYLGVAHFLITMFSIKLQANIKHICSPHRYVYNLKPTYPIAL